jgi:hypothetical protein
MVDARLTLGVDITRKRVSLAALKLQRRPQCLGKGFKWEAGGEIGMEAEWEAAEGNFLLSSKQRGRL